MKTMGRVKKSPPLPSCACTCVHAREQWRKQVKGEDKREVSEGGGHAEEREAKR